MIVITDHAVKRLRQRARLLFSDSWFRSDEATRELILQLFQRSRVLENTDFYVHNYGFTPVIREQGCIGFVCNVQPEVTVIVTILINKNS